MAWAGTGKVEFGWDTEDGIRHNFSHASIQLCPGLFIAAAPCAELPDGGPGEEDMGLRMMSFTSWADIVCKCKVKHVISLIDAEELRRRFSGFPEDLATACRGQGLIFHGVEEDEAFASGSPPTAKAFAGAIAILRSIRPFADEPVVIFCADGRLGSAAVAATWLSLECFQDTAAAVQVVEKSAADVGASRSPLAIFHPDRELALETFEKLVLETSRCVAEAPVPVSTRVPEELEEESAPAARLCGACGAPEPMMCCSRCKAMFFCNAECQRCAWKDHKPLCVAVER